ncbi:MAG: aminoglycoside phosphotransferase family protein [Bacteroidales bacterium]|nr:aminoglycoside phosphotransferase family protein [Bacteroidales bacterium]
MDGKHLDICRLFEIPSEPVRLERIDTGHIHGTWIVETGTGEKYLLQEINRLVFPDVPGLMHNLRTVTAHLQHKVSLSFKLPFQKILTLIPTKEGTDWHEDTDRRCWRMYAYIPGTQTYDRPTDTAMAREAGRAFGGFISDLADLNPATLTIPIHRFHDLAWRLEQLDRAYEEAPQQRKAAVTEEMNFMHERRERHLLLDHMAREGRLPQRITHNDTKLNNLLFDAACRAVCVIDLDTVMPGIVHYDYGDALRTLAGTAPEDVRDLDSVRLDMELLRAFTEGFLAPLQGTLHPDEKETLHLAPAFMTFTQAIRFLTDHLAGDTYYRTAYPGHNLQRAQVQIRVVEEMENNEKTIRQIIDDLQ